VFAGVSNSLVHSRLHVDLLYTIDTFTKMADSQQDKLHGSDVISHVLLSHLQIEIL